MDPADLRSRAEHASADLRQKLIALPDIISEWFEPHGGLSGRKIMDFGCGRGEVTAGLAARHPTADVIGVEVSDEPSQLDAILDGIGAARLSNLSFRKVPRGDLCDDTDFDAIVSWSVFEHIQRNQFDRVVGQLRDRLRPSGLMFTQVSPLYFSPEGSHLWSLGYTDWQHLTRELSEMREDFEASPLTERQREAQWKMFQRLNRLTAPDIEARLSTAGFTILRRQIDHVDREPPRDLLTAYDRDALMTHQIVLLLRRD